MESLISVIVPIFKVELYLQQAIDSIINQTYKNLEIILVDDGSPDNCPAICDEYAEKDKRIKVIHKKNGGLSDARNAGLEIATGEYIGFVDSDDWIEKDMFEYLANGLTKYDADIASCEYYNCYEHKYIATSRPEDALFSGDECMNALLSLRVGNYAWNKLYRASLWNGIRFPVGKTFEDVLTTYKLFEKCKKLVCLHEPKYYYRQTKQSITGAKTLRNEVQRVNSHIERFNSISDRYSNQKPFMLKIVYENAILLRDAIKNSGPADFEDERDRIELVSRFLSLHTDEILDYFKFGRLGKIALKEMSKGTRSGWLKSDFYEKISRKKVELLNSSVIKAITSKTASLKRQLMIDYYYLICLKSSIDNNSVFVESRGGEDFAGNMFFLAKEACNKNKSVFLCVKKECIEKVNGLFNEEDFPGLKIVIKYSRKYYHALGTSKYLFNDMVFEDLFIKREDQIYANTWHGTPLKKLEFDVADQRSQMGGASRDFLKCDYLVVPSLFLFNTLLSSSRVRGLFSGKGLLSGYPRNNVFFDTKKRLEIRKEYSIDDKEVFVYMPTWRGSWSSRKSSSGEFNTKNILANIDNMLKDNQLLFVKLHNFALEEINFGMYRNIKPFPKGIDTYAFLNAADCLITDYSSVFFDFACSRRKIILFAYDKDEYCRERGFYLDLDGLPFPIVTDYLELKNELNLSIDYEIDGFIDRYCTYDCMDSAQKAADYIFGNESACNVIDNEQYNKDSVLLYDDSYVLHSNDSSDLNAVLDKRTNNKDYYYCFRQWALLNTPRFLKCMPDDVYIYSLPYSPVLTLSEKVFVRLAKRLPQSSIKRELNRTNLLHYSKREFVGNNIYDPYYGLIAQVNESEIH